MTPEQQLERVRMCIAEAGYDPSCAELSPDGSRIVAPGWRDIPLYVAWRAGVLAGYTRTCWPCRRETGWHFSDTPAPPCGHPVDPFCAEDAEMAS